MSLAPKSYMPFVGVELDEVRALHVGRKTRRFRVFTYQAYNAMGLIGTECNGIAVCDEDHRAVVCDELCRESSGWSGASLLQAEFFRKLVDMEDEDFIRTVNESPRLRSPQWLEGIY
jgi:PAS domain-containing protein